MVKFKKIDNLKYTVSEGEEIIVSEVNNFLKIISEYNNITQDHYATHSNDMLRYAILTRVVSKYFLANNKIDSDVAMNIIEIRVLNKTAYISIGEFPDIENNSSTKYIDASYFR